MAKLVDLRSDTVTKPTAEMRKAMAEAEVGDDVYREDPTVNRLEELAAEIVGKEAALFVPSGTMGNQIAALTHTLPGQEVIVDPRMHIFLYEVGGLGRLSGVQTRTIETADGCYTPDQIRSAIRGNNIHFPNTGLVCLENTLNRAGGVVIPPHRLNSVADAAHEYGVPVHLDGARIFNAAAALDVDVRNLCEKMDSVMFCLSKGLAAPVGSILAGSKEFINKARKYRKLLGGGMRQAGILAAAGIIALTKMVDRLQEDHDRAKRLAYGLVEIPGLVVDLSKVQSNIVVVDCSGWGKSVEELIKILAERGLLVTPFGPYHLRMVTHKDVDDAGIDLALKIMQEVGKELA
ncbi:threonine aldolase [Anoxybacter fermentans]|uniref:Threonine aldolase n=1 Tax=Anoxybacter fermentans TaxID=1323375 RepID=A0A3S9SZ94_9FIRM|nr:low-specificity L-threonine aldolase [Anoxybacter fermentans]AZR73580.1 threonine aldolase [Anoxybacter fermentans]